ncbi:MAG TPA: hypothetical protein VE860_21055 [Chthoniobacterales bacterium]|jgi:hypothetical protein|nr:hypothetical protein [Chthoniobacterales bacterium]
MRNELQIFAARASLAILASGFSLLGILALVWHSKEDLVIDSGLDGPSYYLGGVASVFTGAIFFAAAYAYRRR